MIVFFRYNSFKRLITTHVRSLYIFCAPSGNNWNINLFCMKRRFYSIFNMTFIRVPNEITTTKWESAKNFIHSNMNQLSVYPGFGDHTMQQLWFLYVMQQFLALHPWKQWKVAILYHLLMLLGKLKHKFLLVHWFLQAQCFLAVSSTVAAETISFKTGLFRSYYICSIVWMFHGKMVDM